MILISSVEHDHSTNNVTEWLLSKGKKFDRINYEEMLFTSLKLNFSESNIQFLNQKKYNLDNYNSYWYRRGDFNLVNKQFILEDNILKETINKFNNDERKTTLDFIHHFLLEKKSINSYIDTFTNKINVLNQAKKIGILIPDTIITNEKRDVIEFHKKHRYIITKPIYEGFSIQIENQNFYLHTILLSTKDIENFPEKFHITKFQECIDKVFELRIFYLKGKFFPSAIFSQNESL